MESTLSKKKGEEIERMGKNAFTLNNRPGI
jgi:hypothetical protein